MNFKEKYSLALDYLYEVEPFISDFIVRMGFPVLTDTIDTASVSWNKTIKTVEFSINPEYVSALTVQQTGFVFAHEAYHVLFRHLEEIGDARFPKHKTRVIAQEVLINDRLINRYVIPSPDGLYNGQQFGRDFSFDNTYDAYTYLDNNNLVNEDMEDPHCKSGFSDEFIDVEQEDFIKSLSEIIVDTLQNVQDNGKIISDEIVDITDDILIDANADETDFASSGTSAGDFQISGNVSVLGSDVNLNWAELLEKINPKVMTSGSPAKNQTSWHSPNRRMVMQYPKVIIPVTQKIKQDDGNDKGDSSPTVILALDLSMSIPSHFIQVLAGLADSMPKNYFDSRPVTWSSQLVPFDTEKKNVCATSGTNIQLVVDYVEKVKKEIKKDPYVIVITDAEFSFKDLTNAQRNHIADFWHLGLIERNNINNYNSFLKHNIDFDKVFYMDDFMS